MYIVNEHGILMGWPDEWAVPTGSRSATVYEIGCFEATGQQEIAKMPPPEEHTALHPPTPPTEAKPAKKGKRK